MKSYILAKLEALQERQAEVEILLNNSKLTSNQERFYTLPKEYTQLNNIIRRFESWRQIQKNIDTTMQLLEDLEMREIALEELKVFQAKQIELEKELQTLLLPKDPDDGHGCFIEIRAGTGGNEAALFAGDLFRMYSRFAETRHWKAKIISTSDGEHGGYKEIIAKISHEGAYSQLKFESGGHRVQRIPETESQGRIHTSTCTVAVIPTIPENELPGINISDLRIDTFRSSGAGGQHVNTTDSAIRITHLPSGLVVECQDDRSQHKNKAKAMAVLGARLRNIETKKRQTKESSIRRNLLGTGDRPDRIRTYHFPQGRVTDHRIGLTLYQLEDIIQGKLDELIQAIIQEYQFDQLTILSSTT
ncbi:peptide chain release factor 1 [Candidatus Curculioniphilus buchneri]|uniref:peptide chain release factor 1 n=1 Tax=Candidatus Curculioniphilus buchneri TaxID=690594 RepID=UPI00376F3E5A